MKTKRCSPDTKNYKYLAGCAEAVWTKCEKYYLKADETAVYYAVIVLDPTLKLQWFNDKWGDHLVKKDWIQRAADAVEELWGEYKGKQVSNELSPFLIKSQIPQQACD